jgi:hypothetical protein
MVHVLLRPPHRRPGHAIVGVVLYDRFDDQYRNRFEALSFLVGSGAGVIDGLDIVGRPA